MNFQNKMNKIQQNSKTVSPGHRPGLPVAATATAKQFEKTPGFVMLRRGKKMQNEPNFGSHKSISHKCISLVLLCTFVPLDLCTFAPMHFCSFLKKRTQFTGLWPETRNSKSEILNLRIWRKKLKTKPMLK